MAKTSSACDHPSLCFAPSPSADIKAEQRPSAQQLFTAATGRLKHIPTEDPPLSTFPAPLILPGDDIALNPRFPGQTFRSWLNEPHRNELTSSRNVLYVAAPPNLEPGLEWTLAQKNRVRKYPSRTSRSVPISNLPRTEDIITHLSAFYHGLEVELCPFELSIKPWKDSNKSTASHSFVGLGAKQTVTRIRLRPSPADPSPNLPRFQLNLNDVLNVAINILPADAYAILLLMDHDLYEDDDDDFCCGRAYGGSRISVVSTARYAPELDATEEFDPIHTWPASHCSKYIESLTNHFEGQGSHSTKSLIRKEFAKSPMEAALAAHSTISFATLSSADLSSIYLFRVVRTAAHELGHCFGLDHCIYYACSMQGTASMAEDVRQPPYLCPVCLAKLKRAVATIRPKYESEWESKRYEAIAAACSTTLAGGAGAGFTALEAWTQGVLASFERSVSPL